MKYLLTYICLIYTLGIQAQNRTGCAPLDSTFYSPFVVASFSTDKDTAPQSIPIILIEGYTYLFHLCDDRLYYPMKDTVKVVRLEEKLYAMNVYEGRFYSSMSLRNKKTQLIYLTIHGAQKRPTDITLTVDFSSEKGKLLLPYLTPWRALVFNKNDEITHYLNELRNRVASGEAYAPIAVEDILEEMRAKGFNIGPIIEALEYKPFFLEQKKKY